MLNKPVLLMMANDLGWCGCRRSWLRSVGSTSGSLYFYSPFLAASVDGVLARRDVFGFGAV